MAEQLSQGFTGRTLPFASPAQPPRIIEFESRRIEVPHDATDDEITEILSAPRSTTPVTDPELLRQLEGGPVTDPELLRQLESDISFDDLIPQRAKDISFDDLIPKQAAPQPNLVDTIMRSSQQPGPTAKPASDRGLIDKIMEGAEYAGGIADQAARGIAEGAANIVGLPVDLVNAAPMALNLLPGVDGVGPISDNPFMGSQSIKRSLNVVPDATADALGVARPKTEPDNMAERVAHRLSEEIGAMAVPAGGILAKAGQVGVEGARKMSRLGRMFVEPAAVNPGRFVRKELQAATADGTGAALANEATRAMGFDENGIGHQIGDLVGALSGMGLYDIGSAVLPQVGSIGSTMLGNPAYAGRVVKEAVADRITENATSLTRPDQGPVNTDPLVEAIMGPSRVSERIPGYVESTADRTGDQGLAALEYSRQSGPGAGLYNQRRAENTAAVDRAVDEIRPQGTEGAFGDELRARRDARLNDAAAQTQAAQARFEDSIRNLNVAMTGEARGADIRTALERAKAAAKEVEGQAWGAVAGRNTRVDVVPLRDAFAAVGESLSEAERRTFVPDNLASIPDELARQGQPGGSALEQTRAALAPDEQPIFDAIMRGRDSGSAGAGGVSLREVTGLRSAFSDALREAQTVGEMNKARVLGRYVEAIDGYMDQAVDSSTRSALEQARAVSRDVNDRFTRPQTAIARVLDRQEGMYRQPDSGVAGKFVQTDEGRLSDFQALIREAGATPEVRAAIRDQMAETISSRGLLNRPDELERYINQHRTVL